MGTRGARAIDWSGDAGVSDDAVARDPGAAHGQVAVEPDEIGAVADIDAPDPVRQAQERGRIGRRFKSPSGSCFVR